MSISEVFPNPTVKQVIYQMTFPGLFYIENKIGDFQIKIIRGFPDSRLIIRRPLIVTDIGPGERWELPSPDAGASLGKKIWQFRSPDGVALNVSDGSLDISSNHHKTYNLGTSDRFRDLIKSISDSFIEVMSVPIINRIGLRYVDECPIPSKTSREFREYYNSTFPLERFDIAEATEMIFRTTVRKGKCFLRYIEAIQTVSGEDKLLLDFDGFAENINPKDYLTVTDELHKIILAEYETSIREPVYRYMRAK